MPNNTYDNWRSITESDFVTLFIKTWFAFVATMRVLHPLHETDTNIAGDGKYIRKYKDDFDAKYKNCMNFYNVKDDFYRVYKDGFKIISDKYPSYIFKDYYQINNTFSYENIEHINDDGIFKLQIKKVANEKVSCSLVCTDPMYREKLGENANPIAFQIEYIPTLDDIINSIKNGTISANETELINQFYDRLICNKIRNELYTQIDSKKTILPEKGNKKFLVIFDRMQNFATKSTSDLLEFCMRESILSSEKLLYQIPYSNFQYNYEDGKHPNSDQESDCFLWFLSFAYRLRNALFHEIIDPLNEEWQLIFKSAYLVLKEIVDGNITYLQENKK